MAATLHETVRNAQRLTQGDMDLLADELQAGMEGEARVDQAYRLLYATDASLYQMEPVAVVFPKSTIDVQHALRVAEKRRIPVLPRGGGTGLAGQTVNHAIVMDFTRHMDQVLEINPEEQWARVQPGLVLASLNRAVAQYGLQYGVDPSTLNRATIGGGIGNNTCGSHSIIFGKTLDQVMSLEAVLSDSTPAQFQRFEGTRLESKLDQIGLEGNIYRELRRLGLEQRDEIDRKFPKILRRVSGYNLDEFVDDTGPMDVARMLVGSEGTLAVTTEARLRLMPLARFKGVAAVHFTTIVEAAEATVASLEHLPSAVELIDNTIVRRCRAATGFRHLAEYIVGDPGGVLLIEFYGESEGEVQAKLDKLEADLKQRKLGYATVKTTDPARQRDMWRMREAGLGLLLSVRGDLKPLGFVEDAAVPPEKLPEYVRRFQEVIGKHGTEAAYYGHASVGCLHMRPMVNVKTADGLRTMEAIASEIADLVIEFGGSLSGEHGDGIVRGVFVERMFGPTLTSAFREVKKAFDPNGLMNPGKIIDAPAFVDNLRTSPATRLWEPMTYLDWSVEGGFANAALQCNGQGTCRKLDGGMCPSYMVTLDEEHSTRGRANLLRLAMTGVLPPSELTGDAVHDALDLCVECKACAAECPSGVDLAKLKFETLAQRNKVHGVPLRSRLFANIATLSRFGSYIGPLANAMAKIKPARMLMQRYGGIHAERPLPSFAGQKFQTWYRDHGSESRIAMRGDAVLFHDTFTDYYHPEVGRDAVRILERLGYRPILVDRVGCCGRPAISKGLLPTAKRWARQNVDALLPYAQKGVPIIGTEPSCLLTFRDEYPSLLQDEASKTVAAQTFLLDELITKLDGQDANGESIFRDDIEREVLLHAHCHQKALVGPEPTLNALRLVPGYKVSLVETSCCGMAGSFGFEAEHYDMSKAMGSMRLFPAVEAAGKDTAIAITGVSCRQQIGHFTSRKPKHAIEIMAEALKPL
ncbi:MAG: FAD-binding protein [Dehalococcoidia bacterium]|nr:FAD-binding protein [Dehalococcoidia bacterium]